MLLGRFGMYKPEELREFYRGKKVLVTGHTGFKGQWLVRFLEEYGAVVSGFSINEHNKSFSIIDFDKEEYNNYVDIRDYNSVTERVLEFQPEILFHLAAETIVIDSYSDPINTWDTNLMGTLNILKASVDNGLDLKSLVIVTTDKVYKNLECEDGYDESSALGGHDPYSASKAAVEIAVESMYKSLFINQSPQIGVATVRSGNVIGGGDWNNHRLIPDLFRSIKSKNAFELRNPKSIRPWQNVFDVINGYLNIACRLYIDPKRFSGPWNFGPDKMSSSISALELINIFIENGLKVNLIIPINKNQFHETNILRLNSSKSNKYLGWKNVMAINESVMDIIEFNLVSNSVEQKKKAEYQIQNFIQSLEKDYE